MTDFIFFTADGYCSRWLFFHACDYVTKGWASLAVQMVKSMPALQETQVQSLGWEDPLEEGMSNHSSILAWRTP